MEKKNINEVIAELSVEQLAGMIDHTFLKPFGDASPIEKLCAEARQYQFAMVAINPAEVETCVKLLEGSGVRVGAAIGFPLGQNTVECKAFETRDAIAKGATEIDTVINVRALQKGQTEIVKKEIEDMVSICKPAGVICKVILETCYLTDEEKETVCRIAKEAGVDFVKTTTVFFWYPTYEMVNDAFFANCIVNIPSTSVITPFCVPLSNTVAPITGSPFSSPTYPFISAFTSFCWLSSIFLLSAAVTTETGNNVKANHNRMQQLSLVRHPCFTLQFIYQ